MKAVFCLPGPDTPDSLMQERENGCLCVRLSAEIGRRTGFLCFIILKSASFSGFGAEFFRQCVCWLPVWKSLSKSAGDLSGRSTERDPSPCIFFAERMSLTTEPKDQAMDTWLLKTAFRTGFCRCIRYSAGAALFLSAEQAAC